DRRRDPRLGIRVADAHADAVQPLPPSAERRAARALVRGNGTDLPAQLGMVRALAELGDGSSPGHDDLFSGHSRRDGPVVRDRPQRLHPDRGYGADPGNDRNAGGQLVRSYARSPARGRGYSATRPVRRPLHVVGWRWHDEPGTGQPPVEAARQSPPPPRGYPAAYAQAPQLPGNSDLPAGSTRIPVPRPAHTG